MVSAVRRVIATLLYHSVIAVWRAKESESLHEALANGTGNFGGAVRVTRTGREPHSR